MVDDAREANARRSQIRSLLGETSSDWRSLEQAFNADAADWAEEIIARLEVAMVDEAPLLMETDVDLDLRADPSILVFALTESRRVSLRGTFGLGATARSLTVTVRPRARLRSVTVRSAVASEATYGGAPRMRLTLLYDDEEIILGHKRTTHASEEAAAAIYRSLLRDLA